MPNELWTAADVIGKKDAEIARLKDELAKQMLADEMLRGLYDDEAADVARLNAELRSMRAGQDALVAAAYEAAARKCWAEASRRCDQLKNTRDMSDLQRARWTAGRLQSELLAHIIRALTPSDAAAALDAMLLAERNKALRDAADRTLGLATGHECRNAILAMIETEGK